MYDLPELAAATDALWSAIVRRLADLGVAPIPLRRTVPTDARALMGVWRDPSLLLGQTCGYPLVTALRDHVRVVARPVYRAPGCDGARHRALLVVRGDDPVATLAACRGRIAAVNSVDSNTGARLFRRAVAPCPERTPFFGRTLLTGAHEASLGAVRDGRADIASIDCVTWALLARVRPDVIAGLRVLAVTASTPSLPMITALATPAETLSRLRAALAAVAHDPGLQPVRDALLLDRFEPAERADYDEIETSPDDGTVAI